MESALQHFRSHLVQEIRATRKDTLGSQHVTKHGTCPNCDCSFEYAADDPAVVWQSEDRGDDCLYFECSCHLFPVFGERITL